VAHSTETLAPNIEKRIAPRVLMLRCLRPDDLRICSGTLTSGGSVRVGPGASETGSRCRHIFDVRFSNIDSACPIIFRVSRQNYPPKINNQLTAHRGEGSKSGQRKKGQSGLIASALCSTLPALHMLLRYRSRLRLVPYPAHAKQPYNGGRRVRDADEASVAGEGCSLAWWSVVESEVEKQSGPKRKRIEGYPPLPPGGCAYP
jgi:hypothetical protein